MKGLHCDIIKHCGKFHDGIGNFSSQVDNVTLINFYKEEPPANKIVSENPDFDIFEANSEFPPVVIITRLVCGEKYLTAYPVKEDGTIDRRCMFGGTYIKSSDSRFPSRYPVALHDQK